MRTRTLLPLLLVIFSLVAVGSRREDPKPLIPRDVPESVRIALTAGRWEEARIALDSVRDMRPADEDLWLYLEALSRARAGQAEDALQVLERLESDHNASPLRNKARFLRSELLAGARRFEEAERLVEELARELRDPKRQGELALVLVERADELALEPAPSQPDSRQDIKRALDLYKKALALEIDTALRQRVLRSAGESATAMGDPSQATGFWRQLLEEEDLAADLRNSTHLALGQSLVASGNGAEGRRTLEDLERRLVASAGGSSLADTRFALAQAWATAGSNYRDLTMGAYDRFAREHPGDSRLLEAAFQAAQHAQQAGHSEDALARFIRLRASAKLANPDEDTRAGNERLRTEALYRIAHIQASRREYGAAQANFAGYVADYPNGTRWNEAQRRIAECARNAGFHARDEGDLDGAELAWRTFLESWPLDPGAAALHLELADLGALRAKELEQDPAAAKSIWKSTISAWQAVSDRFAGTSEGSRALLRMGLAREEHLEDLEGALEAYRACAATGHHQGEANQRLQRLTEPTLEVRTERTSRAGEAAQLRIRARNHESLEVRIYPLDLEAYFRKHLTHTRIEDLDLDLIAPALQFDAPFADYAPYLPLERSLDLPVEGPGVWAVTVTAGKQRATTLVVRSNLEILVKGSRDGALIWALDAAADAPAAGTRLLVSVDGREGRLIEVLTDQDGIARVSYDAPAENLAVLAIQDGHYAADGQSLASSAATQKLTDRGLVYTDRSAYRPGDRIQWRGLQRDAEGGRYQFAADERFTLELVDPAARVLFREELRSNEFGAVDGVVQLPQSAPIGNYRLVLSKAGGGHWQATVSVREYTLSRVELTLSPERRVWFRGEEVHITAQASFSWGAPLAGSYLRYALPDGRELVTQTDQEGRCELRFDSTEMPADGTLQILAWLPEESVSSQTTVILARRAFSLSVQLPGRVVLAGEGFAATIHAADPSGEPLSRELEVEVLRRTSQNNRWAETLVETRKVSTAADGSVRLEFAYDEGGSYVLRVLGTDRFDNPISGEALQFVSGSDDPVQLRLLADSTQVAVGSRAKLRVVQRGAAGLALLTFERAQVLDYRLVRLPKGASPLEFEVLPSYAPGVRVAIARLDRGQLHKADLALKVERGLRVTLVASAGSYTPGEEGRLSLQVTDMAGRPVQAEFSLAIVDDALLRAFPEGVPNLRELFNGGAPLPPAPATTSSCTFTYSGVTRSVSSEVLAEAERTLDRSAWKADKQELLASLGYASGGGGGGGSGPATPGPPRALGGRSIRLGLESKTMKESMRSKNGFLGTTRGRGNQDQEPGLPEAGDTMLWLPNVRSDDSGRAEVRFQVPSRSTRWRALVRGADRGDGFGEAQTSFQVASPLGLELRLPDGIVQGDQPVIGVRILHPGGGGTKAELRWSASSPEGRISGSRSIELSNGAVTDIWLEALTGFDRAQPIQVQANLQLASGASAAATQTLAVRPAGLAYAATRSGLLRGPRSVLLALPDGLEYTERELQIVLGASVESALVDLALGRQPQARHTIYSPSGGPAALAGDLIGVSAVLRALRATEQAQPDTLRRLEERADGLLAELLVGRTRDGGWGDLAGSSQSTHPATTARVAWAFGAARRAGLRLPAALLEELTSTLREQARKTGREDNDGRAALHHALAMLGAPDFAALNRLHRNRNSLSSAALAYTTLALVERKAAPMAAELATLLEARAKTTPTAPGAEARCHWPVSGNSGWYRSPIEQLALSTLALKQALPHSQLLARSAAELWASAPWYSTRARGLALAASAEVRTAPARNTRRITLRVGSGQVRSISLKPGDPAFVLRLPMQGAGDEVRVELTPQGGTVPYQILLTGFSTQLEKKANRRHGLFADDTYLDAAAPRYDGRAIAPGWSVLSGWRNPWRNSVEQLTFGGTTEVRFRFTSWTETGHPPHGEPLMLEIPIPAGTRVLAGSFGGSLGHYEELPGRLLVPVNSNTTSANIHFTLLGVVPGTYSLPSAVVRSLVNPMRMAVGKPSQLRVLAPGETSKDSYRPTPDERFKLGMAQFEADDKQAAWDNLSVLYDTWADDLRDNPLKEAARALLGLALERQDSRRVVEMFELLKERDETWFVPFDEVLKVGAAYRSLGEFERALLIFRATIEETFGADLKVTGTLAELGEIADSLTVLQDLWRTFPDTPQVIDAYLALSDKLLAAAPNARKNASLKAAGWSRKDLVQAALTHQRRFLAFYPRDPRAPDAGLALVSAILELEDFERTAVLAGEFASVFEEPHYADGFAYTQAVAQWYLGEEDKALAQLARIAAVEYADEGGARSPSENRDLALYILGQIHHARRDTDKAESYYEQVEEVFSDAAEALASLREKRLEVAELTTVVPGEQVQLEITWRNVEVAKLLVYRVDLMTLYLREKDLSRVAAVNLAGIAPTLETSVELGGGRDLLERTLKTPLDLPGPGAYLVLARAGETFASGLVLVSDLELDVIEDPGSGRVRVEAQSTSEHHFLRDVDVRVVGSGNGRVTSGQTDPRGLFVADGVIGRATIIARLGKDQYAFHRGEALLAQVQPTSNDRAGLQQLGEQQNAGYLQNVFFANSIQVQERAKNFDLELARKRSGVQLQQMK